MLHKTREGLKRIVSFTRVAHAAAPPVLEMAVCQTC